MNKHYDCIKYYHDNFEGDTYDACFHCGGKCEKYKIATLMPGEKEYMSKKLGIPIPVLEEKYLSSINTPSGTVDVLKMKDGCNFLDDQYRCTANPAKPINCDSYPIVFYLTKHTVKFEIDKHDCPMVHWKEYNKAVDAFATKGIEIIKKLKVPFSWWKMVVLFDEFDVDYVSIDKHLSKSGGYEEFYLEKILGYACNGYEKKARKRGLMLMIERFRNLQIIADKQLSKIASVSPPRVLRLAASYKKVIHESSKSTISFIQNQKAISDIILNPEPERYLDVINQGFRSLKQLEEVLLSFPRRLKASRKYAHNHTGFRLNTQRIQNFLPDFCIALKEDFKSLSFYEINDVTSKVFWDSLTLLAQTFLPNEIDSPVNYLTYLKSNRYADGFVDSVKTNGSVKKLWYKWVLVCAMDEKGHLVGAADGALIVNHEITVFYFSHVAVSEKHRTKGIGSALTAATLQAANQAVPVAWKALGIRQPNTRDDKPLLDCELCEIEFPDTSFAGINSVKRLWFHGRLQRMSIWPLRYSQPDTDYIQTEFTPESWNSVPMFLTYRAFPSESGEVGKALLAVDLMYDYFICAMGKGASWDKEYMIKGLKVDHPIGLIPLPENKSGVNDFIKLTGTLPELLKKYFPAHKFTIDFFNV